MPGSIWRWALWRGLAVLLYFGGIFLFFLVGLDIYTSPPEGSLENASRTHVGPLLLSVVLIVLGGMLNQRMGPRAGSARAHPGHFGFDGGTGAARSADRGTANRGSGEPIRRAIPTDPDRLICPDCGARNERGYRYCGNCAGKLSG